MTGSAVLLGVSIISGTYIFTDTIPSPRLGQLFGGATRGAAVIIASGKSPLGPRSTRRPRPTRC